MRSVYIASTEGSAGKTTLAVGIGRALRERGLSVGYFKPVGAAPPGADADAVDDDARFAADVLGLDDDPTDLCPVVLDEGSLLRVLAGSDVDAATRVRVAYERVSAGKDLVICEGLGEIWQGRFLRTSGADLISDLDLSCLLVARFAGARVLDDVCYVKDALKQRLLGVVFTMVPESRRDLVRDEYAAFLATNGIATYGALMANSRLAAVTVGEIAASLGGTWVSGVEHADTVVESYLIGAMSPEHALRYFQDSADKAVVVGGDRAEIILAALETATAAVVLTGNYVPSATVLGRAEELGVPIISVATDTVAAADGIRRLFGRLGTHDRRKVDLAAQLVEASIDLDRLVADLQAPVA
jgi:uncharacterized protein